MVIDKENVINLIQALLFSYLFQAKGHLELKYLYRHDPNSPPDLPLKHIPALFFLLHHSCSNYDNPVTSLAGL